MCILEEIIMTHSTETIIDGNEQKGGLQRGEKVGILGVPHMTSPALLALHCAKKSRTS